MVGMVRLVERGQGVFLGVRGAGGRGECAGGLFLVDVFFDHFVRCRVLCVESVRFGAGLWEDRRGLSVVGWRLHWFRNVKRLLVRMS